MYKQVSLILLLFLSFSSITNSQNPTDTTKQGGQFKIIYTPTIDSNILVVVNGIPAGTLKELKRDLNTLYNPASIEQVNVWKGTEAIKKYGDKGKAGVVEITLKKSETPDGVIPPPPPPGETLQNNDESKIFDRVEVEASFPGGDQMWRKYLERTLNPNIPVDNGAPEGKFTVVIQFVVDKEGNISDVRPLTHHGYGMEAEVMRVIMKGPKWTPAMQNGRIVKAYRKQPVTFQVIEEKRKQRKNRN
ncbi:MAG: energy transducer TonB [Chitinophagaceae bacterium]|nr:energy transducer TonB [Chitinophagaceae bacterium]